MGKIIVFGATGLVGAYTAIDLKKRGYEVIAVGRRKSDNGFFADKGIEYISVDIKNKNEFDKLPQNDINTIIHLAGAMPAAMDGYNPHEYIYSVLDGTLNVLEYLIKVGGKKIVFAQSRADSNYLMGKTPIPSDIEKRYPLKGDHSVYSICKNAAVDLIEHFHHQYGIQRFELRFPTVYGYHPNPYFRVNGVKKKMGYRILMEKAIKGEPIEIWGDPSKAKEIVYINDVVQIIRECIASSLEGGMYNVGRGVPVTMEEQVRGIVDVFSTPNNISEVKYRPDLPDGREYVNDISKTQKDLGFIPEFDYHKLLVDYRKNMIENPFEKLWGKPEDYD